MSAFVIVGRSDPLYQVDLAAAAAAGAAAGTAGAAAAASSGGGDDGHLSQFVLHSALDLVEEQTWSTQNCYLKVVDRFNELNVSAYVTPSNVTFLLLHEGRHDDAIKGFFQEVHELFIKHLLNPFYTVDTPIESPTFDTRVKTLARRYL